MVDPGPPAPPEYAPPTLLDAQRPGFLDRLGVALQDTPQYSPRPYESGGSAFTRGLLGGAASGFSGGRLLDMKAREENRATTNRVNVAAADRNYALAMDSWRVRLKKYLDENGNVPVNDDLIARYPGLKPFKNRTESMSTLLPYMSRQDAAGAKPNDPMSTADDPKVAKVLGVKPGTQVKTSDYRQAFETAYPKPTSTGGGDAGDDGISSQQQRGILALNTAIRSDPDVKDFVTIRDNYKRMTVMAKQASGQGDLSIIFAYMKVLDPTSVVREAEYNNAAEAVGKLPQLANIPRQWIAGKKLTPAGRDGFISAARALYGEKERDYKRAVVQYTEQAKAFGVDPALVLRDYTADQTPEPQGNPFASPSTPTVRKGGFWDSLTQGGR
jgi:hypothetical protein